MRFRRPNRRRHAPYPASVQITAVLLVLSPVFLFLMAVAPVISAAVIFMVLAALLPWEQWVAAAAAMPKPETPADRLKAYQDDFTETTSTAWNTTEPEVPAAEPAPTPTIVYSARKLYGRESAMVSGHYRRTKSGRKVWVRRHYRRG